MVELLNEVRIGELLLSKGLITQEHLEQALEYQKRYGGRLGWILASLGYIRRIDLFKTLAEHFGFEWIQDIETLKKLIDPELLTRFDPQELAKLEVIPAKQNKEEITILTSYPGSQRLYEFLEKHFPNIKYKFIVITDLDLIKLLESYFKEKFIDRAVHGLFYTSPEYSASIVFSKGQVLVMGILLYLSLVWIYYDAVSYFTFLIFVVQVFYVASILFKLILSLAGAKAEMQQVYNRRGGKGFRRKGPSRLYGACPCL
jgi:GSPII_E N-terminal domain.